METLLNIKNLHANVGEKEILKGLDLTVNSGEVHVIMGPNGAGKSTLANVILNNPEYSKMSGEVIFENENINDLTTDKIAKKGIFMSFQLPEEIPGISVMNFFFFFNVESWLTMRDKFLAEDITFAAANACTDTSNLLRISSEKLSATLLGIAAAGTEAAVFHIGDGAVAVLNNDSSVECLSLPENRDRHNATWFTVDKDAIKHMRITRVDLTNAKALLLMSDGVYQGKEPLDAALELFALLDDFSDFSSIEFASVVKKLQLEDDHTIIILRTS